MKHYYIQRLRWTLIIFLFLLAGKSFGQTPGNALNFNGSSTYVQIPDMATIDAASVITAEAWVNPGASSGTVILGKNNHEGPTGGYYFEDFFLDIINGKFAAVMSSGSGQFGSQILVSSKTTFVPGKWYHVAGVFRADTLSLYVNGVKEAKMATGFPLDHGHYPLMVGSLPSYPGAFMTGSIDEVRIYNSDRSSQIATDMLGGGITNNSGGSQTDLLAYYNFNEASGTSLNDPTGTGTQGTLNGFALSGTTSNWVNSYAMVVPQAQAATNITGTSFTANWIAPTGSVDNYQLDVATNPTFTTQLSGYPASIPNSASSANVTGLSNGITYYYRISAASAAFPGQGGYSSAIKVPPPPLPSITICTKIAAVPSSDQNFVTTYTPRIAGIKSPYDPNNTTCQVMQTIVYFDGLGRPVQTVQVKGNPDATKDVIMPVAYDQFGREVTKYLPYTAAVSDASNNNITGSYRPKAIADVSGAYVNSDQLSFYTAPPSGVTSITNPYSATSFEPSPLNRVLEQGAPGNDWQLTSTGTGGHTMKMEYGTNDATSTSVGGGATGRWAMHYVVTIDPNTGGRSLTSDGTGYGTNQLDVTVSKDENWQLGQTDPRLNTTEEYKDKEGHVVLKRTFNWNTVTSATDILSTYYVYDDFGNLSFVLPPGSNADAGITSAANQSTLNSMCYQYTYDERNRMVTKKIPGKGIEYTVYNSLDQVVATQDSNQRAANQWIVTKYDALGRMIISGLFNTGSTSIDPATFKVSVYAQTQNWEIKDTYQQYGYTQTNTYPNNFTALTINYYDDYNFSAVSQNPYPFRYPASYASQLPDMQQTASTMTRGLLTGTRTAVLNTLANPTPDMLLAVNYYDNKGRAIQTVAQHYLGGTANLNTANYDRVSSNYDFTNEVTQVVREHFTAADTSSAALTIANAYQFDHMGRKRETFQQINTAQSAGANILLSKEDYNDVGQLLTKHLHSENYVAPFLQDISYSYNERGWLLTQTSSKFTLNLGYNTNITTGATPQYNGNIAEMLSTSDKTGTSSKFKYTYDNLNRLTAADHSNNLLTENGIAYDMTGNIQTLNRTGGQNVAALAYSYSGNQLTSVTNNRQPFRTYNYDGNGNATTDGGSKGIQYNLLNLPQTVTNNTNSSTIASYYYEANGTKLRNVGSDGNWDYDNGIVYHYSGTNNYTIEFVQTEEGRAIPNGNSYSYQYNLKDHLGDDRVSFDKNGVLQEDEYYAFGLRNPKYDSGNNNRYLYNGKEIQTDLTNQYDYGARFYDPVIARWTTIDPMAEMGRRETPYGYAFDDPMRFTDPDGMWPDGNGPGILSVSGNFVKGLGQSAWGTVTGVYGVVRHPINTATAIGSAVAHPINTAKAIGNAVSQGYDDFQNGNADVKANIAGNVIGDVAQLFIGAGEAKAAVNGLRGAKVAEEANVITKTATTIEKAEATTAKLSKVERTKTVESVGEKFTKKTEVRPGKGPGQSRAEYVTYKNGEGKTVKSYKDSYDRGNKFQGRKPLRGGPEGRPQ
jgi:RHS repeat-associated protein